MRQDHRFAPPTFKNGSGGTGGQSDQGVGGSDQNVLLLVVGGGFAVVRVAQVVHRVDERLVVLLEFLDHFPQIVWRDGVETKMHMEYIESIVVLADPARLEHQRRPPPARCLPPIRRHRVR